MEREPLAQRMRPNTLDDFVGQQHIVGKGKLLRRAIEMGELGSCIFYGPPGCGKTTLANIIANTTNAEFKKMNAVTSGVADAKEVILQAKADLNFFGKKTYLVLDECHRWSKAQSDCVLGAIEDGSIIFIGTTTENPYTSMTRAIVSRCRVFEFYGLENEDIIKRLHYALESKDGLGNFDIEITDEAIKHLANASGGDVRSALNGLELACLTTVPDKNGKIFVDLETAENSIQHKALSINQDMYYDLLSSFCKSIRGSDTDAALYYSQRMIKAGVDPLIIARRLIAHASEDVGMADSNALLLATSAMYAIEKMGVPEGLLPLSHAIIYTCEAEKSNSVVCAMNMAADDVQNMRDDNLLSNLKNHPEINGGGKKYKYPHDYGGYVQQQYLPNKLKDKIYYVPSNNGREKGMKRKKFMFYDKKEN